MPLQDLIESIASAVSEAWGTLLMKQVGLSPNPSEPLEESTEVALGTYVSCDIAFDGELHGNTRFYVAKTEALTMVGMMMAMGTERRLAKWPANLAAPASVATTTESGWPVCLKYWARIGVANS